MGVVLLSITFSSLWSSTVLAVNNPPKSQADCTSLQYFQQATTGIAGQPAKCINKLDQPRNAADCTVAAGYTYDTATIPPSCQKKTPTSQADCPSGTTFNNVTVPPSCQKNAPTSQKDCTSLQYFQQATTGIAGQPAKCINKVDQPRNAADCAGTSTPFFIAAGTGIAAQPATCSATPPDKTTQAGGSTNPTCESSGFSLSWIFCPIINGLADAVDGIYSNVVQPLLITKTLDINNTSDKASQATYQVWSAFRVYGDIFLVIALLVVVFGQSIGGGVIDAYTAKKVLPRILIAAILINLSIYIVAFLVDITNVIGSGLITLITAPFSQTGNFKITLNGTSSGLGLTALVGGIAWGSALIAGGALIEFLLAFLLLPAFFIMIAVMVTILLRRGLIILLVLVSPVAFALYCLPNTEKYFKKWWDTLIETLLVYPIIAALFAVAKVLSVTIGWGGQTSGLADTFANILSVVALFVPLLLIPFAFRLAGGILGKTHEVLNSYGKKSHQAMLGNPNDPGSWRNRAKRKLAARNAETHMSPGGLGATFNPATMFNRSRRRAGRAAERNKYQAVYGKQGMGSAMYDANKDDSNITGDLAQFATGAESRASAKAELDAGTIDQATYQQRLFSSAAADRIGRDPAMRRRALMNPATIGYHIAAGEEGWNQADAIMHSIAGNDEGTYRSMQNEFQYLAKSAAGRTDLAAAVDGGDYNGYKAWTQVGMYQHGNGKPTSIKGAAQYFGGYTDKSGAYHQGLWERAQSPGSLTGGPSGDVANFTSHLTDAQKAGMNDEQLRQVAQVRAQEAVGIFARELGNMGDGATGSVRDEASKQRDQLLDRFGGTAPAAGTPPAAGSLRAVIESDRVKRDARGYDREDMRQRQARGEL